MFLTDCPTCGLRELRGVRAIELLVNHGRPGQPGHGIDLVFRCTQCGSSSLVDASDPRTEHRNDPAEAHSVSAA